MRIFRAIKAPLSTALLSALVLTALVLTAPVFMVPLAAQDADADELTSSMPDWSGDYLISAPDIPLADGWEEIYDEGSFFDKPEGRILTAYAQLAEAVKPAPAKTASFYRQTMPNLGWQFMPSSNPLKLVFHRDQERLEVKLMTSRLALKLTPIANGS
jgi:hypothetical protein